jgi:ABC-type antimicrobial peptide transport system permease subunit
MLAIGFRRRELQRMVLIEHALLLVLGLGLGLTTAIIAILPAVLSPGGDIPWRSLPLTLAGVFLNGALWTWLATKFALRGELLAALRNE